MTNPPHKPVLGDHVPVRKKLVSPFVHKVGGTMVQYSWTRQLAPEAIWPGITVTGRNYGDSALWNYGNYGDSALYYDFKVPGARPRWAGLGGRRLSRCRWVRRASSSRVGVMRKAWEEERRDGSRQG